MHNLFRPLVIQSECATLEYEKRIRLKNIAVGALLIILYTASPVIAEEVDVVDVVIRQDINGKYRFDVTLRHEDTGWDHYADRWEILDPTGNVLATRVLMHPHVNEQPFTRSLSGVSIPMEMNEVIVRGHDSVHGYGGKEVVVQLP